jgi:hypothetical protein
MMPLLSRWMISAACLYLFVGFSAGALLLCGYGGYVVTDIWRFSALHQEWLLVGWMTQITLGVAYWIFPRFEGNQRPYAFLAYLAFFALNLGILLSTFCTLTQSGLLLRGTAHLLKGIALLCAAIHLWPRIKAFRLAHESP